VEITNKTIKERYLLNPCETLATAFWKEGFFPKPEGLKISHANDSGISGNGVRYFRLIHYLDNLNETILPHGYALRTVTMPDESALVADVINRCYEGYAQTADSIKVWTKYPVFDNNLWVFFWDKAINSPAALGIADFDKNIHEGSLEWIQVLPEYRNKGLGQAIVNELLSRLKAHARFVTVSGEVDNKTSPERLYRKCGFTGNDIWVVEKE